MPRRILASSRSAANPITNISATATATLTQNNQTKWRSASTPLVDSTSTKASTSEAPSTATADTSSAQRADLLMESLGPSRSFDAQGAADAELPVAAQVDLHWLRQLAAVEPETEIDVIVLARL